VAVCLLEGLAVWGQSTEKVKFGGTWKFNASQSDDAGQKVQEAQQRSKTRTSDDASPYPSTGGTYPGTGGGTYPGSGGTYPGGMGRVGVGGIGGIGGGMGRPRGGMQNRGDSVSSEDWDRVAQSPASLRIEQHSDAVVITDDSQHTRTLTVDGKKRDEKDSDGRKVSTKASWESGALVAETHLPHSERLTETYRVSDGGKQLYVVTRFEAPGLAGPVSIRRVYDLDTAAEK